LSKVIEREANCNENVAPKAYYGCKMIFGSYILCEILVVELTTKDTEIENTERHRECLAIINPF
jgi:hypothetical protein